jgi:hypothetical protein
MKQFEHTLDTYALVLPEIFLALMITTRIKKASVFPILKSYLLKTRDFDGVFRSYISALEGNSLTDQNNQQDHGVKQLERIKSLKMLCDILGLDGGKILQIGMNEKVVDTAFYQVRQVVETVLGLHRSKTLSINIKEATRQALVKLVQKYDLKLL